MSEEERGGGEGDGLSHPGQVWIMVDRTALLATIDRKRLDFDFEKICSVSLAQTNVYVCLTCGIFLGGRQVNSPAHQHSLESFEHSLFMNLYTRRVYRLPENEEFEDESLCDIRYNLFPTYDSISRLDETIIEGTDLHGRKFITGFIGINNIKANDYANVCLQVILHIKPIRDALLLGDFCQSPSAILRTVSEAGRKIWNDHPFKALLSPHEFMQAVSIASDRRFSLNRQGDSLEFFIWLLNTLQHDLSYHHGLSIVAEALQGRVQVSSKRVDPRSLVLGMMDGDFDTKKIPFYYLSLELPPVPLYQSVAGEYVIPQVTLATLLEKYDGGHLSQRGDLMQAYALEYLPEYLVLHFRRFKKTHLVLEKNRTIISHPLHALPVTDAWKNVHHYDIIANICHVGEPELGKGQFLVQLQHPATRRWYQIHDLLVKEIAALSVPLSESYIQIWQRAR